jgi:hypothetical protein
MILMVPSRSFAPVKVSCSYVGVGTHILRFTIVTCVGGAMSTFEYNFYSDNTECSGTPDSTPGIPAAKGVCMYSAFDDDDHGVDDTSYYMMEEAFCV